MELFCTTGLLYISFKASDKHIEFLDCVLHYDTVYGRAPIFPRITAARKKET
jgi:hypothetical protein